jgi:hypothetical protein
MQEGKNEKKFISARAAEETGAPGAKAEDIHRSNINCNS